mgnify:CR=1 FL=1
MNKEELVRDLPNKTFCPAPFLHTYINANNRGYKLCCMSHIIDRWNTIDSLKEQHEKFWTGKILQKIRKSFLNGEMPETCKWWCGRWESEGIYHKSDRLNFIKRYKEQYKEKFKNMHWDVVEGTLEYKKPVDIDLRPSKLCNLKCRSCNSLWSNQIEQEVLNNPQIQKWSHWDMVTSSKHAMEKAKQINYADPSFDVVSNLDFNNVFKLKMSGGETLIDPRVFAIIEKIVAKDYAKNIELHFITNCTSMPSRIFKLLNEFKYVTFNVSVDGIGKTDEFLRDGTVWNKKIKIFEKLFTLKSLKWVGIMHVVQPLSALQVSKNTKWFLQGYRKYKNKHIGVTFNPIVDPWYLSVSWLDNDHKDFIREEVYKTIKKYNMTAEEQKWFDLLNSELDKNQPEERKIKYANDFVRAENALNKIRKTNTLKIEPKLKRYFDRYDQTNITHGDRTGRPGAHFDGKPKPTV